MNYWRMAFRDGSYDMHPHCVERGIAAICYHDESGCITGDCRKLTEEEYGKKWKKSKWRNPSGQGSLRKFVYRMKPGDVIYVKKGPLIEGTRYNNRRMHL